MGPGPVHGGGGVRAFLTVAVVVLLVLAIGGGAFWYFVIRPTAVPQTELPVPGSVNLNAQPSVPVDNTPPPPTFGIEEPPSPVVTEPPPGANVPPPTPVTNELPPTTTEPVAEVDTDQDGLNDRREIELGTDPNKADTDGDTLTDGDEVLKYGTNPLLKDTDGDGFDDAQEIGNGYDPRGAGKCVNPGCVL